MPKRALITMNVPDDFDPEGFVYWLGSACHRELGRHAEVYNEIDPTAYASEDDYIADLVELAAASGRTTEFEKLVLKAFKKAHGDSNDGEIEALQAVMGEACGLLNVDDSALRDQAEKWAEENDLW